MRSRPSPFGNTHPPGQHPAVACPRRCHAEAATNHPATRRAVPRETAAPRWRPLSHRYAPGNDSGRVRRRTLAALPHPSWDASLLRTERGDLWWRLHPARHALAQTIAGPPCAFPARCKNRVRNDTVRASKAAEFNVRAAAQYTSTIHYREMCASRCSGITMTAIYKCTGRFA